MLHPVCNNFQLLRDTTTLLYVHVMQICSISYIVKLLGIYLLVLHNNSDKESTTAIVCFSLSGRLKSQHALKVSRTSWGYTVVELKHITKKSTNQSRVHVREPKCDMPSKDKGLSHDSRAFFSSSSSSSHFLVCLRVFPVRMPFQGRVVCLMIHKLS